MTRELLHALTVRENSRPPIWLDFLAYARRAFLGEAEIPWLQCSEFLSWDRQIHALLRPSVACLPLGPLYDVWLQANPATLDAMSKKARPGFALRQLLSEDPPRQLAIEHLRGLRDAHASMPLVISIPSPRRWLKSAHECANPQVDVEPSADDVETASVYVADFLRSFADSSVDGLLLEEEAGRSPSFAEALSAYQPVMNIARHYRWALGLFSRQSTWAPGTRDGFDFCIGDTPGECEAVGTILPEGFWEGSEPPPLSAGDFYYGQIPEQAVPERVLERLAQLSGHISDG